MNIFKEAAKFIGWLTGSLAGIGAILYACGYLITQTHLHLLGLEAVVEYGNEYYLQKGANFFIVVGVSVIKTLMPIVSVLFIIAVPFYLLITRQGVQSFIAPSMNRLLQIHDKRPWLWRTAILLLLVVILFVRLIPDIESFQAPLEISDLLFITGADSQVKEEPFAKKIKACLINGETDSLKRHFEFLLFRVLEAGMLLFLAWRISSLWRLHLFIVLPFIIVFMLYLVLLPMDFGVLMKRIESAGVKLVLRDEKVLHPPSELFLLNKSDKEIILWDRTNKKALLLQRGEIIGAEIGQHEPLFKKK